jgi:hypothetical protein
VDRHPDPHVDAAVIRLDLSSSSLKSWPVERGCATPQSLRADGMGLGDETFTIGLFSPHPGEAINEPIVRIGNLAAIPTEPVRTKNYGSVEAYLVETRSIGGFSGSPVFIHPGQVRVIDGQLKYSAEVRFSLLGIVHGHWDTHPLPTPGSQFGRETLTTGISIVVPIHRVLEIFEMDRLKEMEAEGLAELAAISGTLQGVPFSEQG